MDMTPEAQRLAIAQACGITEIHHDGKDFWWGVDKETRERVGVPDYLNDLNEIHEVETVALKTVGWMTYGEWLFRVTDSKDLNVSPMFHATAAQRAEAFLKAIGKWEK